MDRNADEGPLIPPRAEEQDVENVLIAPSIAENTHGERGEKFPPAAVTHTPTPACFLMRYRWGRREKAALSHHSSVVVRARCSRWVWLHYHLPPQANFPLSKHARFPQPENTYL